MRYPYRRRGIVSIWFALVGSVLVVFMGIALDISHALLSVHQLQNCADAASLAGARLVRDDPAEAMAAAIDIGGRNNVASVAMQLAYNGDNLPAGDVVIGKFDRGDHTFTPTLEGPNAVKAVARRTAGSLGGKVPLFFARIVGIGEIALERAAVAMIGGGTGAGLVTLNKHDPRTFRLDGTVTLNVYDSTNPEGDGAIQVNSDDPGALFTAGHPELLASEINCCAPTVNDPPDWDGDVNASAPYMPDPLAGLIPPAEGEYGATVNYPKITGGSHTLSPGYYPAGLDMTGGDVTLNGGLYVLGGMGLNVTGGDLTANGVMFYLIDTAGVNLVGNGAVSILPYQGEPWEGMAIWQAAGDTTPAKITGTDQFDGILGTLYFPDALVNVVGTSDSFQIRQLVCDSLEVSGNGTVTINYDGRYPAPGTKVFLVQ
jgi:hypothetical protein